MPFRRLLPRSKARTFGGTPFAYMNTTILAGGFGPSNLFRGGEPGIWLDPSDLTTLFQDRAGTTPVTAPGQSVGLILDKSQGLVLGPELVTGAWVNSGTIPFDSFLASGSGFSATKTVSGTQQQCYSAPTFNIVAGGIYDVTINVSNNTFSSVQINLSTTTTQRSNTVVVTGNGVKTYRLIATSTQTGASLRVNTTSADVGSITVMVASVRELPGFHAVANSDAARGTYQIDETGRPFILFDGADDGYSTPTITPGVDKVQVFAGVRKLSDAAVGVLVELSSSLSSFNGSVFLAAPGGAGSGRIDWSSKGTVKVDAQVSGLVTPVTVVATGIGDIAGDVSTLRINGALAQTTVANQGTGNYLAYPLYIGRRGGTSLPFNGRIYSLIVRFGPNLTADQIARVERFIASRTGVTL